MWIYQNLSYILRYYVHYNIIMYYIHDYDRMILNIFLFDFTEFNVIAVSLFLELLRIYNYYHYLCIREGLIQN